MPTYRGSCHCGAVAFEVDGEIEIVRDCNCSICRRKGFLHWIVPRDRFRLLRGEGELTTYRFGTGVAQHRFCRTCGVSGFYVPRSHPDGIDVNVRCLEDVELGALHVEPFDGRNWEASVAAIREEEHT